MTMPQIPQRTCLATGEVHDKTALLRFVKAPNGEVVFDLSGKAPGRGAYCLPNQSALALALKKRAFERKLAGKVPENFIENIIQLLKADALKALGLAKKANALVLGVDNILGQRNHLAGVLLAADMGQDAAKRLQPLPLEKCTVFKNAELAEALGQPHVAAAGLTNAQFWPKFRRLNGMCTQYDA